MCIQLKFISTAFSRDKKQIAENSQREQFQSLRHFSFVFWHIYLSGGKGFWVLHLALIITYCSTVAAAFLINSMFSWREEWIRENLLLQWKTVERCTTGTVPHPVILSFQIFFCHSTFHFAGDEKMSHCHVSHILLLFQHLSFSYFFRK